MSKYSVTNNINLAIWTNMYTSASADKYVCKAHFTLNWTETVAPRQGIVRKKKKTRKIPQGNRTQIHCYMLLAPITTYTDFNHRKNHGTRVNSHPFKESYCPIHSAFFEHNWDFYSISQSGIWTYQFPNQDVNSVDEELQQVCKNKTMLFSTTFKYMEYMKVTKKMHLFFRKILSLSILIASFRWTIHNICFPL